jgi:hypothetical protein
MTMKMRIRTRMIMKKMPPKKLEIGSVKVIPEDEESAIMLVSDSIYLFRSTFLSASSGRCA